MNLKTNPGDEDNEDNDANPGADLATTSDSCIPATSTLLPMLIDFSAVSQSFFAASLILAYAAFAFSSYTCICIHSVDPHSHHIDPVDPSPLIMKLILIFF